MRVGGREGEEASSRAERGRRIDSVVIPSARRRYAIHSHSANGIITAELCNCIAAQSGFDQKTVCLIDPL